jgi:hypothetical protein
MDRRITSETSKMIFTPTMPMRTNLRYRKTHYTMLVAKWAYRSLETIQEENGIITFQPKAMVMLHVSDQRLISHGCCKVRKCVLKV